MKKLYVALLACTYTIVRGSGGTNPECDSFAGFAQAVKSQLKPLVEENKIGQISECDVVSNCTGFTCSGTFQKKPAYVSFILEYCLPVPVVYVTTVVGDGRVDQTYVLQDGQVIQRSLSYGIIKLDWTVAPHVTRIGSTVNVNVEVDGTTIAFGTTIWHKTFSIDGNVTVDPNLCPKDPPANEANTKIFPEASGPAPDTSSWFGLRTVARETALPTGISSVIYTSTVTTLSVFLDVSSSVSSKNFSWIFKSSARESPKRDHKHGPRPSEGLSVGARIGLVAAGVCLVVGIVSMMVLCGRSRRLSNRPTYYNDASLNCPLYDELDPEGNDDDAAPLFDNSRVAIC